MLHLIVEVALLSAYLQHNVAGLLGYVLQEGHTQAQALFLHYLHLGTDKEHRLNTGKHLEVITVINERT